MVQDNSTLIPSVAYVRRSTDKQEASIHDQCEAVKRYADEHGYHILRWYTDDGISGDDTKKRHEFLRMLADAQDKGDFKAILCWDQDRFGRFSPHEASYRTWPLAQAGIQLVTTDKGPIDWNDFMEWLMYSVNQQGKHQFLRDLSRNVARGQLEAAKAGSWLGLPPYAYRVEGERKNKRLVLGDADKVRVVQRIFREFVEDGRSLHNIAERLQEEGYPSPGGRGKPWRFDVVRHILENPAYCGDYASGRYAYGKYNSIHQGYVPPKERKCCAMPESEWIIHRDHHEAIIERIPFEQAKAILAKGKTGRSRYTPENNPFILSTMLRCGRCGCPMWAVKNHAHNYYECGNRQYNGKAACDGTTVREDVVLRSIADHLNNDFLSLDGKALVQKANRNELTPDDLPKAFAKVKSLVAPPKQPASDRKRAEKMAEALANKIDKARHNLALLEPENIPTVQEEIRRMQTEKEQLDLELRKRPPTERDINAETSEILKSLVWMAFFFRVAAKDKSLEQDWVSYQAANMVFGDTIQQQCRTVLRKIEAITVHTTLHGHGSGIRHAFERGEIAFKGVGGVTERENPHKQLQRLPACH